MSVIWNPPEGVSLSALEIEPDGMGHLLIAGTTSRVLVGLPAAQRVEATSPGGGWTMSRITGTGPRMVTVECVLKCATAENLNLVEAAIESVMLSGVAGALHDGWSRTGTLAQLIPDGTKRKGFRERVMPDAVRQEWTLVFLVLAPQTGGTVL